MKDLVKNPWLTGKFAQRKTRAGLKNLPPLPEKGVGTGRVLKGGWILPFIPGPVLGLFRMGWKPRMERFGKRGVIRETLAECLYPRV